MKTSISLFLAFVFALSLFPLSSSAAENISGQGIVSCASEIHPATDSPASSTKTATKKYAYYGSDGTIQWTGSLTATFEYDGISVTCIAAECTVFTSNHNWYTVSNSTAKIGNNAYGYLAMGIDYIGIPTREEAVGMKMSCSPTGVIT